MQINKLFISNLQRLVAVGTPVTRTPPAQIQACGIPAPGSSDTLASAFSKIEKLPLAWWFGYDMGTLQPVYRLKVAEL